MFRKKEAPAIDAAKIAETEERTKLLRLQGADALRVLKNKTQVAEARQEVKEIVVARLASVLQGTPGRTAKECLSDLIALRDFLVESMLQASQRGLIKDLYFLTDALKRTNEQVDYFSKSAGDSVGGLQVIEATPEEQEKRTLQLYGIAPSDE